MPRHEFRTTNGTLYRPDESFEPFVSPVEALDRGLLDDEQHRHVLQNRVHYALGDYLNGGTPHSLDVAADLLADVGVNADPARPLDVVTAYYDNVHDLLPSSGHTVTVTPDPFDVADYQENALEREVSLLVDRVRSFDNALSGAYLHGSFGDGDYVRNYSDVDLLIVVDESTLVDADALQSLREDIDSLARHYLYVDPHQHHGVMVAAEPDLRAYNRAYLPPVVLSRARTLLDDDPVEFRIRDDELECQHGFWRVLQTLRQTVQDDRFPAGFDGEHLTADRNGPLYCLKHFTSVVQLLPSLYATARGSPVYKADSFTLPVLNDHPDAFGIVDRCSVLRRRYPDVVSFARSDNYRAALADAPRRARREYPSNVIPDELWRVLGDDYFTAALEAGETLWTEIQ